MTWHFILVLAAGAAVGGFVNGLAGFGTSMFALGFWLQIIPPAQAVSVTVIVAVASGLQGLFLVRQTIIDHPKRLLRFLLPSLLGIPIGVSALSALNPVVLKLGVAGFLVLYGGFFMLRRNLPVISRPMPLVDGFVGFLGGFMGGAASLSGVLPTMWCSLRPWQKSETRAVLQPFNIVTLSLAAVAFAIRGNYTARTLTLVAIALPIALTTSQIGIALFKRLQDDLFRRLIIALMFVSGITLFLRELI